MSERKQDGWWQIFARYMGIGFGAGLAGFVWFWFAHWQGICP